MKKDGKWEDIRKIYASIEVKAKVLVANDNEEKGR